MSEKTELTYRTKNPTKKEISYGDEKIIVDHRITAGKGKSKGSFVFAGVFEEEPKKETGKTVRSHTIGDKEIYVLYKRS